MSELKCPFCHQELEIGGVDGVLRGCPICRNIGTEKLWEELICARKALDVAVEELTKIKTAAESVGIGFFMTAAIFSLAKIKTELEQKDVK